MSVILMKRFFSLWLIIFPIGLTSFISPHFNFHPSSSSAFSYSLLQGSKVSVQGSTNINEFTCFSDETYSQHSANLFINDLKNNITFHNVILNVTTESLQCGNEVMNRNLYQTLSTDKYPFIVVELLQASTKDGQPLNFSQWMHMTGKVYLSLAGERRVQQIDFVAKQSSDGIYHFIGEHNISLSQYNLDPPTALFGLVKVKDIITVKFDLFVKANGAMTGAKALLKDFNFNKHAILNRILMNAYRVDITTGAITLESLVPERDVMFPDSATHLSLQSGFARIDFAADEGELQRSNIVNLAIDETATDVVLSPATIPALTGVGIFLLKISFLQLVNGVQYLLKNGIFNSMAVVEMV